MVATRAALHGLALAAPGGAQDYHVRVHQLARVEDDEAAGHRVHAEQDPVRVVDLVGAVDEQARQRVREHSLVRVALRKEVLAQGQRRDEPLPGLLAGELGLGPDSGELGPHRLDQGVQLVLGAGLAVD